MRAPTASMRPLASRPRRRRAAIGLTPLIDVVFILLVFFMLASNFLHWRTVDLSAAATSAGRGAEGALMIVLAPDGARVAGSALTQDALNRIVAERLAQKPEQRIIVRPIDGTEMQPLVALLDQLVVLGARDVALMTSGE